MKFLILVLLLSAYLNIDSQSIIGVVRDTKGNPVSGAILYRPDKSAITETNSLGIFMLDHDIDHFDIVVSHVGFLPFTISHQSLHTSDSIRVFLKEKSLSQVVITDRKQSIQNLIGTQIIDKCELGKLACCNLAESFENSNTVDVVYTDGVMGGREIQLLGLNGTYSQQLWEGLPYHRGITHKLGLELIPGFWIDNIGINKGIGSVTNGFENITGQINIDYRRPRNTEKLSLNGYISEIAKSDFNIISGHHLSDKVSTNVMAHSSFSRIKFDNNNDGFMDMPQFINLNLMNKWYYNSNNGYVLNAGIQAAINDVKAGQMQHSLSHNDDRYTIGQKTREIQAMFKSAWEVNQANSGSLAITLRGSYADQSGNLGSKMINNRQTFGNANLIYMQNWMELNTLKFGLNYQFDLLKERIGLLAFDKNEHVIGGFGELQVYSEKFKSTIGARIDHHDLLGLFFSPRIDIRFTPNKHHSLRISSGFGFRTPAMLSEISGFLISNRSVSLPDKLEAEKAWNSGISYRISYNISQSVDMSTEASYFLTYFTNQIIYNVEQVGQLRAQYLSNGSRAQDFQIEHTIKYRDHISLKLSYRNDYNVAILDLQKQQIPLIKQNKWLANLTLNTHNQKWQWSSTLLVNGSSRIPNTSGLMPSHSPPYLITHSQINFIPNQSMDFYIGCENIFNYMQQDRIVSSHDPSDSTFDGGMIWGPMDGRRMYIGAKWTLK